MVIYQDLWAAGLFIAHLAVICWLAFGKGLKLVQADATDTYGSEYMPINIRNDSIIKVAAGGAIFTVVAGEWMRCAILW